MWESIASEDLRSPDQYAWYCRRARDLLDDLDKAIWQVKAHHVQVPDNFWRFEDRPAEDDPDWNEHQACMWDRYGMTRDQSVAHYHRRWRENAELEEIWSSGGEIVTAAMEAERRASGALSLEDVEIECCGADSDNLDAAGHPNWDSLPFAVFLWGPNRCGKTALAQIIGWMMHNMVSDQYRFTSGKFRVPPDAVDSAPMLLQRLLEEMGQIKNGVVLLDDFLEGLPDPTDGDHPACMRRWMLGQLCYEVRKGQLRHRLRSNKTILIVANRSHTAEDAEDLQATQAHYYLRLPTTDAEHEAVAMMSNTRGGL